MKLLELPNSELSSSGPGSGGGRQELDTERRLRCEASRLTQEAGGNIIIIIIIMAMVMSSPFLGCLTAARPATLSASGFQLARLMAGCRDLGRLGLSRPRLISTRDTEIYTETHHIITYLIRPGIHQKNGNQMSQYVIF